MTVKFVFLSAFNKEINKLLFQTRPTEWNAQHGGPSVQLKIIIIEGERRTISSIAV